MSEEQNLCPVYDDEPSEDAYKRGALYKMTKARAADYEDGKLSADDSSAAVTANDDSASTPTEGPAKKKQRVGRPPQLDADGNPIPKPPRLPKKKVAVMIGYCGTGYHGMQYNPPHPTIEAALFKAFVEAGAISKDNSDDLKKNGFMRAARTDKGVHAGGNLISLKMIVEDPDIKQKINDLLPEGIRVWDISRVNKAFDCRKMCGSRWYEYLLPTYSLIGPKPGTVLYNDIEGSKKRLPGVLDEDLDSKTFWENFQTAVDAEFTPEEQERIRNYTPPPREEFSEADETYQLVRQYRLLENLHRRRYRISNEKLQKFRSAMNQYLKAHNFHNYTVGKPFKEASAIRNMKDIKVSDPFVMGNAKTEWLSIKIHGQSFMLHQIRKMICMATLITRCGTPVERISQSFGPQKINIPKAPALGLLLEAPVFETYNPQLVKFGYKPINFADYQEEIDSFKMKHIYDKIYKEEVDDNVFNAFFSYIDSFNKVNGAFEADEDSKDNSDSTKKGSSVRESIFKFLTAEGIPGIDSNGSKGDSVEGSVSTEKKQATEAQELQPEPQVESPADLRSERKLTEDSAAVVPIQVAGTETSDA